MTTEHQSGPLPVGTAKNDELGVSGPHTHPVAAPHEFTQEAGTPTFSKGPHPEEQNITAAEDMSDRDQERRASAEPRRY